MSYLLAVNYGYGWNFRSYVNKRVALRNYRHNTAAFSVDGKVKFGIVAATNDFPGYVRLYRDLEDLIKGNPPL